MQNPSARSRSPGSGRSATKSAGLSNSATGAATPEIYQSELEANAATRRLKRSLSRAGLPPKLLHATTAAERRANERGADAYFNDPSRPEPLRQFTVFAESLTDHMLKNGARMREFADAYVETRVRMGLPLMPVETIVYARAVEIVAERIRRVDLLTSRDVAAAVRSTKAEVRREEREQQMDELMKAIVVLFHQDSGRLDAEAEMENRARAHRGMPRVPAESLVVACAAGRYRARALEQVDQSGCSDRRPHRKPAHRDLARVSRRGRPIGSSTGALVVDGDERTEQTGLFRLPVLDSAGTTPGD